MAGTATLDVMPELIKVENFISYFWILHADTHKKKKDSSTNNK